MRFICYHKTNIEGGRMLRYSKTMKSVFTAIVALYLLFLTACGDEPQDKTVSIAISPSSKNVELGDSVELTVTAKNTGIKWPDQGEVDGSFTLNGNKATYSPPSSIGTYRFTVSAEANPSKNVTAKITVVFAAPQITITPASSEIKIGKTIQFTAHTDIPTGQPQVQDPLWEVSGNCGTIDQNGLFSAASAGDCTVRASLKDINNKKITESAAVKIKEPTLQDILGDMVHVSGGTFTMGCTPEQESDCYSYERPAHQVTLSDYYIGKYEVTQFVWRQVMGMYNNPSGNRKGDNFPVENVSWDEAQTFIEALNEKTGKSYRLPTEAEWEYAARGGNQSRRYLYSGSNTLDEAGWYNDNSDNETHPVGMKKSNELGIYDMSGNVDEWVNDLYGAYNGNTQSNPTGPESGSARVVRGGSSVRNDEAARVFSRGGCTGICDPNPNLGFRLAITSTK